MTRYFPLEKHKYSHRNLINPSQISSIIYKYVKNNVDILSEKNLAKQNNFINMIKMGCQFDKKQQKVLCIIPKTKKINIQVI